MPMYFGVRKLCHTVPGSVSRGTAQLSSAGTRTSLGGEKLPSEDTRAPQDKLCSHLHPHSPHQAPPHHRVEVLLPPTAARCGPRAMLPSAHHPSQAGRTQEKPPGAGNVTGHIMKSLAGNTSLDKNHLSLHQESKSTGKASPSRIICKHLQRRILQHRAASAWSAVNILLVCSSQSGFCSLLSDTQFPGAAHTANLASKQITTGFPWNNHA